MTVVDEQEGGLIARMAAEMAARFGDRAAAVVRMQIERAQDAGSDVVERWQQIAALLDGDRGRG